MQPIRFLGPILALLLVVGSQSAHGSSDYVSDQELIGWSQDGLTWVTQLVEVDYEGKRHRTGFIVYMQNQKRAEYRKGQLDALRKKYPYVKTNRTWRDRFKARFTSKASHRKYEDNSRACMQRWRLIERSNGQVHYLHKAAWYCSDFYGGYVHASQPIVLLKYLDDQTSFANDGYCCSFDKTFRWVQLGANLKHVPPGPADKKVWPLEFCGMRVARTATSVGCGERSVTSARPLRALSDVVDLNLSDTRVSNLRPLAKLASLTRLSLMNTPVVNLRPLERLKNLEWLNLFGTLIRELAPLASLTKLKDLDLRNTKVRDLGPVAQLTRLEELALPRLQHIDLGTLSQLSELRILDLGGSTASNLSALAALSKLQRLLVHDAHISEAELQVLRAALPNLEVWGARSSSAAAGK